MLVACKEREEQALQSLYDAEYFLVKAKHLQVDNTNYCFEISTAIKAIQAAMKVLSKLQKKGQENE